MARLAGEKPLLFLAWGTGFWLFSQCQSPRPWAKPVDERPGVLEQKSQKSAAGLIGRAGNGLLVEIRQYPRRDKPYCEVRNGGARAWEIQSLQIRWGDQVRYVVRAPAIRFLPPQSSLFFKDCVPEAPSRRAVETPLRFNMVVRPNTESYFSSGELR